MTLSETKIQNVRFPTVPVPGTSVHIGRSSLFAMVRSCDFGGPPLKTIFILKVAIFVRVEMRRTLAYGLLENVLHSWVSARFWRVPRTAVGLCLGSRSRRFALDTW